MNETEVKKCPKCGGDVEEGLLNAGGGVDWLARTYSERLLSPWHWKIPMLKAWRCKRCELVIFTYDERALVHKASERWVVGDEHE
jgi:hypothetical protein